RARRGDGVLRRSPLPPLGARAGARSRALCLILAVAGAAPRAARLSLEGAGMADTLHADSLGITESVIMGIAGTAPAYSIEITTSTIIGTAGPQSPASILACGLIMFGIAFAFIHLNRAMANAGTSFAWVSMVFGPALGFLAGWALLVLCCVFMVSALSPAANATLLIFRPDLMNNVHYVTIIAAVWLTFV